MNRLASTLLLLALAPAALPAQTTTTYSQETANNTSACAGQSYCQGPFTGMQGGGVGTWEPAPRHVSDVPVTSALYAGSNAQIYAHLVPWFTVCHTGEPVYPVADSTSTNGGYLTCNSHVETGYSSNDAATVKAQMDDMKRRGFAGVVVNWYGKPAGACPGAAHCTDDGTTLKIRDDLAGRCGGTTCPLHFSLDVDKGSYDSVCASNSSQPSCIYNQLASHLDYANTAYFGSPAYLKTGSRPVVSFFIILSALSHCAPCPPGVPCAQCTGPSGACTSQSGCWSAIWSALGSHVQGYSHGNPMLIFENATGFTETQSDGAFAWKNHNTPSCRDPADTLGLCYLDNFYRTALSHASLQAWGGAWMGSVSTAAWNPGDPSIPLRCGRTWLDTLGAAGAHYSSANQLPFLQVVTWNDYNETTAMEPGIDNCWAAGATAAGSTLTWTLSVASDQPNAASDADEETIDHYVIWDSADGEALTQVATAPRGARSVNLSALPLGSGPRLLYVEAVGGPSIFNKWSPAVSYPTDRVVTISTPTANELVLSPVRVAASAASSTPVTLSQIYLDGAKVYETHAAALDTDVPMSAGSHRLTVQAYDSAGTFKTTEYVDACALSATSPSVTICTPADQATVASPVRVLAGTTSANPVTLVQIYLDGAKVYELASDRLDHPVAMSSGTHRLTVQAYDSAGTIFKSTIYVTVP